MRRAQQQSLSPSPPLRRKDHQPNLQNHRTPLQRALKAIQAQQILPKNRD